MTKTILSVSLMILTCTIAPVVAQAEDLTVRVVRFDDLNLATSPGIATLDRRLKIAVKEVCGDSDPRNFELARAVQQCRTAALASVTAQRAAAVAAAAGEHSERLAAR